MAIERNRALLHISSRQLTKSEAKKCVGLIWLASFSIALPSIIEYSVYAIDVTVPVSEFHADDPEHAHVNVTAEQFLDADGVMMINVTSLRCGSVEVPRLFSIINGLGLVLCVYVVPMMIITVMYTQIVIFALRQHQNSETNRTLSKKKVKIVKMLSLVALLFALCWIPYFSLLAISVSKVNKSFQINNPSI